MKMSSTAHRCTVKLWLNEAPHITQPYSTLVVMETHTSMAAGKNSPSQEVEASQRIRGRKQPRCHLVFTFSFTPGPPPPPDASRFSPSCLIKQ